jgi:hypothetical protein
LYACQPVGSFDTEVPRGFIVLGEKIITLVFWGFHVENPIRITLVADIAYKSFIPGFTIMCKELVDSTDYSSSFPMWNFQVIGSRDPIVSPNIDIVTVTNPWNNIVFDTLLDMLNIMPGRGGVQKVNSWVVDGFDESLAHLLLWFLIILWHCLASKAWFMSLVSLDLCSD